MSSLILKRSMLGWVGQPSLVRQVRNHNLNSPKLLFEYGNVSADKHWVNLCIRSQTYGFGQHHGSLAASPCQNYTNNLVIENCDHVSKLGMSQRAQN
jgi:hypothetical protein